VVAAFGAADAAADVFHLRHLADLVFDGLGDEFPFPPARFRERAGGDDGGFLMEGRQEVLAHRG
jgi:hypothetical protein